MSVKKLHKNNIKHSSDSSVAPECVVGLTFSKGGRTNQVNKSQPASRNRIQNNHPSLIVVAAKKLIAQF